MAKTSGVCDTRCQLFHKEMIKKENVLRIKWFLKNQQRLIDNLGEPKLLRQTREMITESEKLEKPRFDKPLVQQKPLPLWRPPTSDNLINIDVMKPIDPDIKTIFYEKEIPTFIATDSYLRQRYKEPPEKRYYFPEYTSWTYGWRLNDYPPVPLSKIGVKSVMSAQFYHRKMFNLQRYPEWYRGCQIKNARNFNELLTY